MNDKQLSRSCSKCQRCYCCLTFSMFFNMHIVDSITLLVPSLTSYCPLLRDFKYCNRVCCHRFSWYVSSRVLCASHNKNQLKHSTTSCCSNTATKCARGRRRIACNRKSRRKLQWRSTVSSWRRANSCAILSSRGGRYVSSGVNEWSCSVVGTVGGAWCIVLLSIKMSDFNWQCWRRRVQMLSVLPWISIGALPCWVSIATKDYSWSPFSWLNIITTPRRRPIGTYVVGDSHTNATKYTWIVSCLVDV